MRHYLCAVLLFAAALMCKPSLVILPGVLLLLDFWPLGRIVPVSGAANADAPPGPWKILTEKVPFVLLSIGSAIITIWSHAGLGIVTTGGAFSFPNRVQNAIVSYGRYLKKFFLPVDLAILYPYYGKWSPYLVVLCCLLLLVVTGLVLEQWRRRPWLSVGWFWFVGGLLPAIGIIQVGPQSMADRFVYFPIIGIILALVWTARNAFRQGAFSRQSILVVSLSVMALLAALSVEQIGYWKEPKTLWEHALKVTRWNYVAETSLGQIFLEEDRTDVALAHAQMGALLKPTAREVWCLIGNIYKAQGNWPAAITNYQKAAELSPKWLDIPLLLAQAFETVGETSRAIGQYRRALALDSDSTVALNNLAWILATDADARVRNGPEAVRLARRACELTQEKVPIHVGTLAAAYAENGQFDDAIRTAGRAAERARVLGDAPLAERNLQLQKVYAQRQPFRQE